ncbi:putative transcription initiation factor TFIID 111 kDa subunit [Lachnellula suecica]|uniref:Putative transcription initiation factor TFIID 111 kDa subunit n=1 Tax=Lachnellula suecica TaxID=602035 RepID=A0A8T9BST4_9HELO|nr:putative transcription initiation factor TFIID 111 kDa subunit [Lachnellula suecica]
MSDLPDPASFADIDWDAQDQEDKKLMNDFFAAQETGGDETTKGLLDPNRPLEGEKADDALDFGDISDEDLPEEEDASDPNEADVPALEDDVGTSHDTDDLFGEDGRDSSPFNQFEDDHVSHPDGPSHFARVNGGLSFPSADAPRISSKPEMSIEELRAFNFPSNQDPNIPAPATSNAELLEKAWPKFQKGINCNFNEFLSPLPSHYPLKTSDRRPKPVHPTKVSLDLAPDQEKNFYSAGAATGDKRKRVQEAEAKGLVPIIEESSDEEESDEGIDFALPDPKEKLGGFTFADLEILCGNWDPITPVVVEEEPEEEADAWEMEILGHAAKRRKIHHVEKDYTSTIMFEAPSFDNFEEQTKRIAKRVLIDLNDPHMLIDEQEQKPAKRRRIGPATKSGKSDISSALSQRFNMSNDGAYDALKQNHKSKVRATLGNISVEHSLPALRLQWPYYRVKLFAHDARSWHRPSLHFNKIQNQPIHFSKPWVIKKKKGLKNHPTHEIFKESKDLSLADHYASATLLEYSEEHPTILSNFGMGNRIINYYRREKADDETRPMPEDKVGDVTLLLPEDRSPFAKFGHVEPGETVRTLQNAMYRAPIFKHEPKGTDFLVIRSTTGVHGMAWHIRNIDHLFAVGQEFPLMEVPSPHSRKVTTAAKYRMRMIGMRKIKHSPQGHLKIGDVTAHIQDSSDMQNRQKLKEYFQYDKVEKVWKMKPNEVVMDEAAIRSMIKPEDVCALDAMQVGARALRDAGLELDGKEEKEGADDEDNNPDDLKLTADQLLEKNLAPWKTTKAFLDASAEKGMLDLHGAGDPSGCGLAINMTRVSMKGGFIAKGAAGSSENSAKEALKKNGHGYNVKEQEEMYKRSINEIWTKQKDNLSNPIEHSENEMEIEQEDEDRRLNPDRTPHSMATPIGFDDSASQISRASGAGRSGRAMRIIRKVRNKYGQIEDVLHVVKDARVMREYQKRRHEIDNQSTNVYDAKPTGNAEWDRLEAIRVKTELARLERNKERRQAREKQKGILPSIGADLDGGSPSSTPAKSIEKPTGTTRKCANCGQAGHIKTNKKLCPMLNGQFKPEDRQPAGFGAFGAAPSAF